MFIEIYTLIYEHFILWWQTKYLSRMFRLKTFMEVKMFYQISLSIK